jgi:ferredoxin-NADP reductase
MAMRARLITVERVADAAAAFWFELDAPFEFQPGQTCDVTLPAAKYHDDKGTSRTFSIASSPSDMPRLLVATRLTGSAFKRSLEEAAPGTDVEIDGPYGSLTLHRNAARPAVLMAGGIGITPFRSIVKDATERKLPHTLTLFYSNRTAASTAFLADLERWESENPNFRLVATITEPDGRPWRHATGMVDATFLRPRVTDPASAIYYVAGPPAFVGGMRTALDGIGADPDNIRTEEFAGY